MMNKSEKSTFNVLNEIRTNLCITLDFHITENQMIASVHGAAVLPFIFIQRNKGSHYIEY